MTIPVKWFHSGMTGAPLPDTAVNTIISILDACLINGFNVVTVNTLTYDSVTGKCTATVGAGHGFDDHQVVLIEGANEAEFNGEVRITVIDANQFSYVPATAPTVANATGTITAKAAPVGGWTKAFSGVNKAVYQSADPLATGFYLRVDDSLGTDGAQVTAYLAMTGVDTGTDQWADGWWRKSDATNSLTEWALVGDSRAFYLMLGGSSAAARSILFFGDVESFLAGDGYHCALTFDTAATGGTMNAAGCVTDYGVTAGHALARDMAFVRLGEPFLTDGLTRQGAYPDPVTGGIAAVAGLPLYESANSAWRGGLPGARQLLSPAHRQVHDLNFCLQGKNHLALSLEAWR